MNKKPKEPEPVVVDKKFKRKQAFSGHPLIDRYIVKEEDK
jgi:hypothetical protein